jgi:hypothetical protein
MWEIPMIAPRCTALFAAAVFALCAASAQASTVTTPKPRPAASATAKVATDTRVYLLRGLLNIFSLGMDTLAEKLNAIGIQSEVFNHDSWYLVAAKIADDYKRGQQGAVVLIGHSLGADVLFQLTERLDKEQIPVRLVVPFDPTSSYEATKNVDHLLNLYQHNGFGRRVAAGPGFKGELVNKDLSRDESIGHGSIDKAPQLHDLVIAKIRKVALGPAPRKRAPTKPNPATSPEAAIPALNPAIAPALPEPRS